MDELSVINGKLASIVLNEWTCNQKITCRMNLRMNLTEGNSAKGWKQEQKLTRNEHIEPVGVDGIILKVNL